MASHPAVLVHMMKYGAPGTPTILAPVGGYTMFYNNSCGNYNCSTNCCYPCGCGWGNGGCGGCGGFGLIGALVGLAILGSVFGCGGCW